MNLSSESTNSHWNQNCRQVADLLSAMAARDTWALDAELSGWLVALGRALDSAANTKNIAGLSSEVVEFVGWLSTPAAMRLIEHLESESPGSTVGLVKAASLPEAGLMGRIFLERLQVLRASKMLCHVFSLERMKLICKVLGECEQ